MYNSINDYGMNYPLSYWMYSGKTKQKQVNKFKNDRSYLNAYNTLFNLCINMFEWEGLPDTIDERFMEGTLITNGRVAIAKDEELGFIALPFTNQDLVTIYGYSPRINLYGRNGYNKEFDAYVISADNSIANAVRGYDNPSGYPYVNIINEAAERISETSRSIDVGTTKLKNPYIIMANANRKHEVEQYMKALKENHDAILLAESLAMEDAIKVEKVQFDVAALDALWEQKRRYSSEAREALGIENNENIDKSERLLVDEVNANNTVTQMNLDVRLRSRQEFCEIVNEQFGLNISVKIRHDEMLKEFKGYYPEEEEEEIVDETIS